MTVVDLLAAEPCLSRGFRAGMEYGVHAYLCIIYTSQQYDTVCQSALLQFYCCARVPDHEILQAGAFAYLPSGKLLV